MKDPVIVLNFAGDRGNLKALNLCDRLVYVGIAHLYEKVGDCYTVTVAEKDVSKLAGLI